MSPKMDEVTETFDQLMVLMEKNLRGVQIGCYSIALIGLTVAIRRVRPFSQFKRPSDVPDHFLRERRELKGFVKRIEPNGSILMVHHKPLLTLPLMTLGELPVKIAGVNISGLGLSWLQTVVAGNEIKIIPILKDTNSIQCEVILPQATSNKKVRNINLGESLINVGFGSIRDVEKPLQNDSHYLSYYNRLKAAETYALRKKMGIKYYIIPTKNIASILLKKLNKMLMYLTKQGSKRISKLAAT